jgi:SpoVK/Ycf46/Vps4 family AAA+-type ATPase
MFKSLGLLATDAVVECSASDLIAGYVGQTGPATRKKFEEAVGGVLFIDEAYRCAPMRPARARRRRLRACFTPGRNRGAAD